MINLINILNAYFMKPSCKFCDIELTAENRSGTRKSCKPCRSKEVMEFQKTNSEWRKGYINAYVRRIGRVKQYPCKTCNQLCYKKYAQAFCSDKCRFMANVTITEECWLWNGPVNRRGYGKLSFQKNKSDTAHRVAYKLFNGPIEDNSLVCHSCDKPRCVKPGHLWLGTHKENMMDMVEKGRQYSKLTMDDVLKIRELVEKFGVAQEKIKEQFKISSGHISSIIKRRVWKHI